MQLTNFAQTCRTYDNKTFRRPTFYRHVEHTTLIDKPLIIAPATISSFTIPRPQTPFSKIINQDSNTYTDAFDLYAIDVTKKDTLELLDSDSDLSENEETNKEKTKAWKNYVKVTDSAEETIKKTYYCRKCFEKFKSKLLTKIKNKSKTTLV